MKRLSRVDIVNKICRKMNLPNGKETLGYFTRQQLLELLSRIENREEKEMLNAPTKEVCQGKE